MIRCIDKHVGRSWNKVFSELTADLELNSAIQYHVRLHIDELVRTDPGPGANIKHLWRKAFYVDERGILRRVRDLATVGAAQPAAEPTEAVRIGDPEFKQKSGLWFETTGGEHDGGRAQSAADRWPYDEPWKAYQRSREPRMRQLSKRALRQLGLRNEAK